MEFHPCPRNHPQELRAVTGSVLCASCIKQVENNLRALPGLYQECLHHIIPPSRRMDQTKVSGSRKQDHLNVSALDTRYGIVSVLESWSQFVVDERGVTAPTRSVPQLVRFLVRHLEWLAGRPPAADFADEIDSLRAELLRTIDPGPGDAHGIVRQCVVDDCTGTIVTSPHAVGRAGKSSISCSSGHTWEMHEWIILRQLMERQRKEISA
jgi:hypothetical protein